MNTPTHLLLSVAALTRRGEAGQSSHLTPTVVGAILPDSPMFAFYAIEKWVRGSTEREIWTTQYFLPLLAGLL